MSLPKEPCAIRGAHHWLLEEQGKTPGPKVWGICEDCGTNRTFDASLAVLEMAATRPRATLAMTMGKPLDLEFQAMRSRRHQTKVRKQSITFTISEDLVTKLQTEADATPDENRSSIVDRVLRDYFERPKRVGTD